MILINGREIAFTQFPDGTASFRFDPDSENWYDTSTAIVWKYDGDQECIQMWYLVNHIRSIIGQDVFIHLVMPYIPNARMDRVKKSDEVFTLKWFADFINALKPDEVTVLDPHSNVAPALINNIRVVQPDKYIRKVISAIADDNLLLCYPDEGAAKRYSDLMSREYVFGIKHRDWRTGKLKDSNSPTARRSLVETSSLWTTFAPVVVHLPIPQKHCEELAQRTFSYMLHIARIQSKMVLSLQTA